LSLIWLSLLYSSFWWFPGVWILCADISEHCLFHLILGADVSEHSVCSIFLLTPPMKIDQCSETSTQIIKTEQSVPKSLHIKFGWNREYSQTFAHKIQTPGNYPEESIQHSEHGKSLKCSWGSLSNYMDKFNYIFNTVHWKIIFSLMSCEVRLNLSCFKILVAFFRPLVKCPSSLSHALTLLYCITLF